MFCSFSSVGPNKLPRETLVSVFSTTKSQLVWNLDFRTVREIFPDKKQRVFPSAIIQCFSKIQRCYSSKKHGVSSSDSEKVFSELYFFHNRLNTQQYKVHFFGTEIILGGLPLTSKAASNYFGQMVRYWMKRIIPRFGKSRPETINEGFT